MSKVKIALLPGKVATPVVCVQLHLVLPTSKAPPLPMEQPDAQWELGCLKRAASQLQEYVCPQCVSVFCWKVYEGYGQTECTAGCTFTTPGDWTSGRMDGRCGDGS